MGVGAAGTPARPMNSVGPGSGSGAVAGMPASTNSQDPRGASPTGTELAGETLAGGVLHGVAPEDGVSAQNVPAGGELTGGGLAGAGLAAGSAVDGTLCRPTEADPKAGVGETGDSFAYAGGNGPGRSSGWR